MRHIAKFILWIFGWKLIGKPEPQMKKCIFIQAPHTSMWDFLWGRLGLWQLGVNVKFLIKKEIFFFPLGSILKALGGIPIDRTRGNNVIDQIVELFNTRDEFSLVITPEGTRKYTEHWKKGFYYISMKANVPVYISFLDYEKKEGGPGSIFNITGDFEKDFVGIQEFYKDKVAKYPERFNLSRQYQK